MSRFSLDVLRLPDFRCLLLVRLASIFGMQCQSVIVGWQVYALGEKLFPGHGPLLLGLAGLAEALPAIALAPFTGHWVDHGRPYKFYFGCFIGLLANALVLMLAAGGHLALADAAVLGTLFAATFAHGLIRAFIMPSNFCLLPLTVARTQISAASAWLTAAMQFGYIVGPLLAGLVFGFGGAEIAWWLPVGSLAVALWAAALIRGAARAHENPPFKGYLPDSLKAGWIFLLEQKAILGVMALDMLAVMFGGAIAILPAFADQILATGPQGLGLLRAAPAIGALGVALFLAVRPMKVARGRDLLLVVVGFGVCMIGFGVSQSLVAAMAWLALSGALDSVSMVIRGTLVQLKVPDHLRGRVFSINGIFIISSNEIGAFESGVAATALGLGRSIVFNGAVTLAVAGLTAWLIPSLRRAEASE